MKSFKTIALTALATCTYLSAPVGAEEFTASQKQEIESILRGYLLSNPEILAEAQQAYELKQRAAEEMSRRQSLNQMAKDVFHLTGDAVVGNTNGNITVVEFLDYNCGWCKRSIGELAKLLEQDMDIRVVMKEFPIFGEGSEYAAKAALASVKQNKYWEFHQAMFAAEQQVTPEVADQIAAQIGLNLEQLKRDMEDPAVLATLARNQQLAQSLLLTGTPAFIIDRNVIPGYIPHDKMAAAIAEVRAAGGCKLC